MTLTHHPTNGSTAAAHPAWLAEHVRGIDPDDRQRFEGYLGEILGSLGMSLDEPGTADTPRRFLQALIDATDGYEGDPKLVTVFPTECHGDASCELAQGRGAATPGGVRGAGRPVTPGGRRRPAVRGGVMRVPPARPTGTN